MSLRPIQRLASAAAALLLLGGCAAQVVDAPAAARRGEIAVRPGRPGFVVAAPQAVAEPHTGTIAAEVARRTGFGLVVASGVDRAYAQRVRDIAQGPLRFYAEIHGDERPGAGRIEIATAGIDHELAQRWRALAEMVRDAHLRGRADAPRLEVLVEPAQRTVAGARREPIPGSPERAMQIELPPTARDEHRQLYTAILADFVAQAAALPPGR